MIVDNQNAQDMHDSACSWCPTHSGHFAPGSSLPTIRVAERVRGWITAAPQTFQLRKRLVRPRIFVRDRWTTNCAWCGALIFRISYLALWGE